ncbi:MAG: YbbR-like domain-containing protein [Bacteroidales bacterium]|nr:YbbR-like domain-containing protein [Bacteroidales bacterium]
MDIKAIIKDWLPKAEAYFSTFPWKNLLTYLFFLLIAFVFWLMLFFQKQNVEGTYRLPLKYTNIPENVVFNNTLPQYIDISVTDNGSEIFKLDIRKRDSLEINVSELAEEGNTILQGEQFRQLLRTKFASSTIIRGYYPMTLSLETSELESKELVVTFDGELTTSRANLIAGDVSFIPEKVMAYGSRESLNQLTTAATEYTLFKNLNATSQLPIKINPVEGVRFSPSEVEIYIPVVEFTEQSFDIAITATHLPRNIDVKFFPSRAKVSFSVTLEDYVEIVPEDFAIELDYREFRNNDDGRVELKITKSPASIIDPKISPSSVEFLFENIN